MKNRRSLTLNIEYAADFGAYWMIYAIAGSFASVFMLGKGYQNVHIGMTLAGANLLALALQPFVADRMDRVRGVRIIDSIVWLALFMMLSGAGLLIFPGGSLLLAAGLVLLLSVHTVLQPLMNSLAFRLSGRGAEVSFGIGRAGGSLGYSAIIAVLGTFVEKSGVNVIPVCAEAACALLIGLLLLTKRSYNRYEGTAAGDSGAASEEARGAETAQTAGEQIDIKTFIRRNKYFFIMNLGIAGLFFSNAVLSNYMAQIAEGVGGTTEDVGRILSLMAFAEIPVMLFYDKIRKLFKSTTLIAVSALGFTGKIAFCWLARSVGMLFAAQGFQFFAFALMMPAMVYYTDEIMSPGEAVKGQALFTMMITLSTIAASLLGGWILDAYSARALSFVATLVTAAGAAVVIATVRRTPER